MAESDVENRVEQENVLQTPSILFIIGIAFLAVGDLFNIFMIVFDSPSNRVIWVLGMIIMTVCLASNIAKAVRQRVCLHTDQIEFRALIDSGTIERSEIVKCVGLFTTSIVLQDGRRVKMPYVLGAKPAIIKWLASS